MLSVRTGMFTKGTNEHGEEKENGTVSDAGRQRAKEETRTPQSIKQSLPA
jgi:hypothetical protein